MPDTWILTRKSTGEVIGEFYDYKNVLKYDPKKVLIETAREYLGRINQEIKDRDSRKNPMSESENNSIGTLWIQYCQRKGLSIDQCNSGMMKVLDDKEYYMQTGFDGLARDVQGDIPLSAVPPVFPMIRKRKRNPGRARRARAASRNKNGQFVKSNPRRLRRGKTSAKRSNRRRKVHKGRRLFMRLKAGVK